MFAHLHSPLALTETFRFVYFSPHRCSLCRVVFQRLTASRKANCPIRSDNYLLLNNEEEKLVAIVYRKHRKFVRNFMYMIDGKGFIGNHVPVGLVAPCQDNADDVLFSVERESSK